MNGILISLEGPDGAGKTTVLQRILPELEKSSYKILSTREPGGVRVAEEIRNIILSHRRINETVNNYHFSCSKCGKHFCLHM